MRISAACALALCTSLMLAKSKTRRSPVPSPHASCLPRGCTAIDLGAWATCGRYGNSKSGSPVPMSNGAEFGSAVMSAIVVAIEEDTDAAEDKCDWRTSVTGALISLNVLLLRGETSTMCRISP